LGIVIAIALTVTAALASYFTALITILLPVSRLRRLEYRTVAREAPCEP
jgi:hypothetical protein